MTDDELNAIRQRVEAATPGPWYRDMPHARVCATGRIIGRIATVTKQGTWSVTVQDDANALFIAHAREDIPALLAEVERLRREVVNE